MIQEEAIHCAEEMRESAAAAEAAATLQGELVHPAF